MNGVWRRFYRRTICNHAGQSPAVTAWFDAEGQKVTQLTGWEQNSALSAQME